MGFTYNDIGEEIRRLFVPSDDPGCRPIPREDLVIYNVRKQVSQLQFKPANPSIPITPNEQTVVVYIDGACRGNGKSGARASYGVYFGPNSRYNTNGLLPESVPQTSTSAEIEAFAMALQAVKDICSNDFELQHIIFASDSAYLVTAMSLYVEGWIENEGIGSKGEVVAHYERLKALHEMLDEMEFGDDGGIEAQFWHIDRRTNREADALANVALNERKM